MAASRFSPDVLELVYGPISEEENKRQKRRLEPVRVERGIQIQIQIQQFWHGF